MNRTIIIYGAGRHGRAIASLLINKEQGCVEAFVDQSLEKIGTKIQGIPVLSIDEGVKHYKEDGLWIVCIFKEELRKEVVCKLRNLGCDVREYTDREFWNALGFEDQDELDRNICSVIHESSMEEYFEEAEHEEKIAIFWGKDTVFYKEFQKLDLTNVVELACGRGRHVPMYKEQAGHITLVDILEKNIEFCRKRFMKEGDKISYYCNNGYDLKELPSDTFTSLFTYDAMVHFELVDVYRYIHETFRILRKGGLALFHHSNNGKDYKASFIASKSGRNFNSKELFAHIAYRAGFEIVNQTVIDWNGEKGLDCLTLVRKPEVCE